jgi:Flp pilus assembly protein CpaB
VAFACVVLAALPMLRTARSAWGPPVTVVVASTALPAGTVLEDAVTALAQRPADVVPPDVVTEASGILTVPVVAGTVLTERHRAPTLAALVGAGEVAIPVPADMQPAVAPGAVVDLLSAGFDSAGRTIAAGGRVLQVDGSWIWVAVPAAAAADAAAAALDQRLVLAVRSIGAGDPDR